MIQTLHDILSSRTLHIIVTFPIGAMALLQLRNIYMDFLARRRDATTQEESEDDMDEVEKMFGKTLSRFTEPYFIIIFVCHVLINFVLSNEVLLTILRIFLVSYTTIVGVAVLYRVLKYFLSKKTPQQ